ncbi:MAG: DUF364 domain-containing protein [Caldisphaeraceae archaeon]|nr:DUF364 domain-containing protein [Caldisphaeraceae archaeon]MEB3692449.1 DUF364 domain-containing protein [Caldisphaeraceae archaeon]MEB3797457.1 DUF364 domain-containing protein [Caldisphaeraceae archaeon]
MSILKSLVDYGVDKGKNKKIKRVLVGQYAYVELDNGNAGVSWVYKEWVNPMREIKEVPREADLASQLINSHDPVEVSIGIATINALSDKSNVLYGDPLDYITIENNSKVAIIGYFKNYIDRLKDKVSLYVFELRPQRESFVYPWYEEEYMLGDMDYIIASGSTIATKTIDRIAEHSKNSYLIVTGPTTPMVPEAFQGIASIIGGVSIIDKERIYELISMGYGFKLRFSKKIVKVL